jgi:hypothetical protein
LRGAVHGEVSTIGLDIAKSVFQIHDHISDEMRDVVKELWRELSHKAAAEEAARLSQRKPRACRGF